MIDISCTNCNVAVSIFKSRDGITKYCSRECFLEHKKKVVMDRERSCKVCGDKFIPRKNQIKNGRGIFCSVKCRVSTSAKHLSTKDARDKAYETAKKTGFIAAKKMRAHANTIIMRINSKLPHEQIKKRRNETLKKYRASFPDKQREWSHSRNNKKTGKLPSGWIKKLRDLQQCKCAVCKKSIKNQYHMDHKMPLAKGGVHEKFNIQLLCPTCNLRKSAKDPIDFMQSMGFLL